MIDKLEYTNDHQLIFLDQTLLPLKEKYIKTKNYKDIVDAIVKLRIRGAPLVGITAAYGVTLGMHNFKTDNRKNFEIHFHKVVDSFRNSRPTAKNLFYALERMEKAFDDTIDKETGFKFQEYTGWALMNAVREALGCWQNHDQWKEMVRRGMAKDFSWDASAAEYSALYRRLLR